MLAVLALVVTAASAVSGPGVGSEVRVTLSDGKTMRLMAAAVAAAARDLIGVDHECEIAAEIGPTSDVGGYSVGVGVTAGTPRRGLMLDERLLDLPPPA